MSVTKQLFSRHCEDPKRTKQSSILIQQFSGLLRNKVPRNDKQRLLQNKVPCNDGVIKESGLVRVIIILLLMSPLISFAAIGPASIRLERVPVNLHDIASIKRGAKLFATQCMVCHTAKYLRHNKLAQQAGVLYSKMPIGERKWVYATPPPDLTLIASVRGPRWLYTYLHSFYQDPKSPTGSNNLLMPNTSMPNILQGMQGTQELVNGLYEQASKPLLVKPHWYDRLKLVKSGTMTPEQFNQATIDLVDFLDYASDPHKLQRYHLGYWVLGFLIILAILLFFVYKEFWRDVNTKSHKDITG